MTGTGEGRTPAARSRRSWLWLRPGIGIKRWLVVSFAGLLLLALASGLVIRQFYRDTPPTDPASVVLDLLSLQFLDPVLRLVILVVAGGALLLYGGWRLMRVVIEPYQVRDEPLGEVLYQRRLRARGPRVVAIGGGRGLSVLLRGLKDHTNNITAVVTVADDGGSSGKLRRELGIPPMGDIRDCIAALADAEPTMTDLLLYRFRDGDKAFGGHAFGNLLITALTDLSGGDFEEGVRLSNRVLAVRGNVLPVAAVPLTLHASYADGTVLDGQHEIGARAGIERVWYSPADVEPSADALAAIADADLIVYGPGSLFTSVMPGLLMPKLREALQQTDAGRLFICNVATQVGETQGFTLSDHLAALERHGLLDLIDGVLANDNFAARAPADDYPAQPVRIDTAPTAARRIRIFTADVVDDGKAHHHDAHKLAAQVLALWQSRALVHRRERARRTTPSLAAEQVHTSEHTGR